MPIRHPGILSAMLFCAVAGYPAAVPGHPAAGATTISAVYTATPPHLDGKLDDAVWLNAAVVTDLHMVVPDEYTQPSEDSRILVLYDRQAIHFAARFNDREAGKVTAAINLMSPGNDVLRPSYRDPAAGRRLLEPGRVYELRLENLLTGILIPAGHRIRVQVSASFAPHFSRNLQTGASEISESASRPARISIHYDSEHRSRMRLPIIERQQLGRSAD